ncbi:hypothetical protein ACFPK9_05035 [Rubritalea spongiae]|uniref:Nicotinamide riboside transporter PnuC n=1 Tax=Rubritalea spongiae TaxID=430797 RepID=A0ABW5E5D0_9BACT
MFLQVWGGSCYLANKVLFSLGAKSRVNSTKLQITAWLVYLLGVPAWVIILAGHQNWIAASVEAGGIPSMLLGLYNSISEERQAKQIANVLVSVCTYAALVLGVSYSVSTHGGIGSIAQVLEFGVMLGFLFGSYYMAKRSNWGWGFFMLMNVSMASLMFLQGKPILMGQQLLSLAFVVYGFISVRKKSANLVITE